MNRRKFAQHLRSNTSLPEVLFWKAVKDDQLGCRVRRQVPKDKYFLDFYIAKYRLAIEIDGEQHHHHRGGKDILRDEFLKSMQIKVLRIEARSVLSDIDAVSEYVRHKLSEFDAENSKTD